MNCTKCVTGLLIRASDEFLVEDYAYCLNCSMRYWPTVAEPIPLHHLDHRTHGQRVRDGMQEQREQEKVEV